MPNPNHPLQPLIESYGAALLGECMDEVLHMMVDHTEYTTLCESLPNQYRIVRELRDLFFSIAKSEENGNTAD